MLLDDLLETSVVELCEASEVMNIGDDVAQIFLQQHEVLFQGHIVLSTARRVWRLLVLVRLSNDIVDLSFTGLYSLDNFLALDLLKGEHLVQFSLQLLHEALLIFLSPCLSLWLRVVFGGLRDMVGLEGVLQAIIVDIMVVPVLDQRSFELVTESVYT